MEILGLLARSIRKVICLCTLMKKGAYGMGDPIMRIHQCSLMAASWFLFTGQRLLAAVNTKHKSYLYTTYLWCVPSFTHKYTFNSYKSDSFINRLYTYHLSW